MLRLWRWYQNCLRDHPLKTQIISSGLIWGFGDVAAQTITHSTAKRHRHLQVNHELTGKTHALQFRKFGRQWSFACMYLNVLHPCVACRSFMFIPLIPCNELLGHVKHHFRVLFIWSLLDYFAVLVGFLLELTAILIGM